MSILQIKDPNTGEWMPVLALKGKDGYTPIKGVDYWTEDDKAEIAALAVIRIKDNGVVGVVDADNNIILSGTIANGTYTLKYENEDGTYSEVGTLTVASGEENTNLAIPTSTDWKTDYRLNSSGAVTSYTGCVVTNFIPVKDGDVVRVKGINLMEATGGYVCGYDTNKTKCSDSQKLSSFPDTITTISTDEYVFSIIDLRGYDDTGELSFVRFSGSLTSTAENVVITVEND